MITRRSEIPANSTCAFFRRCRYTMNADLESLSWGMGVGKRTLRRWEDGSKPIPGEVWGRLQTLLRDAGHNGMARVIDLRGLTEE